MPLATPTIVLVPGAWHSVGLWAKLQAELEPEYPTIAVQLPSVGTDASISASDDAAVIATTIKTLVDEGRDVVLVAHSYAGIPSSQSTKDLSKRARAIKGKPGGVVSVIYMTSHSIAPGSSLLTAVGGLGAFDSWCDTDFNTGLMSTRNAKEVFYTDVNDEDCARLVAELKSHSYKSFTTLLEYAPYDDIPCTYLRCTADACIAPVYQDMFIDMAGGREKIRVVDIDASHSPMVSKPKECARLIVEAASLAMAA